MAIIRFCSAARRRLSRTRRAARKSAARRSVGSARGATKPTPEPAKTPPERPRPAYPDRPREKPSADAGVIDELLGRAEQETEESGGNTT